MSTTLQQLSASQNNQELRINEMFDSLSAAGIFSRRHPVTSGLTWGYYGGRFNGATVADGTVALTASTTNYVVARRSDGVVSVSTATTNWNNPGEYARLYQLTTSASAVTAVVDARFDTGGLFAPAPSSMISHSADYTFVLADANTTHLHPSADTTARTWTIPANGSVAYPVGTELEIVNQNAAGNVSIAITTDTMRLAGAGTTGTRTLAANGVARAKKLTSTEWLISGTGLT